MEALNEFLEFDHAIEVDVKISKSMSIILKFLLKSVMYNAQELLNALVAAHCWLFNDSFLLFFWPQVLEVLETVDFVVVVVVGHEGVVAAQSRSGQLLL